VKGIVRSVASGWRSGKSRPGFTLAELMVALAVGAIILGGSMAMLYRMVTVSSEHRDETMAVLQVQFVGFWISEDVVQAQEVIIGETPQADGELLTVRWTEWDGDENRVSYTVSDMENEDLWRLTRTHFRRPGGSGEWESAGDATIAEYLDRDMTFCEWTYDDTSDLVLTVEVFANVDGSEATATYGVHPRALT
jgi:prepilin-type N-terminal cleavage/methylation domain-containing protein